jgi:hypothetical protein
LRLAGQLDQAAPRSVLELRGLGKDVWLGASVEEYLARERSSSPPVRTAGKPEFRPTNQPA